jgi:mono/diheme cytochrome c family protein
MARRVLILAGLLVIGAVAFALAACGGKGTVAPLPNTVEGPVVGTITNPSTTTTSTATTPTTTTPTTTTPAPAGDATAGKAVFLSAGCTGCHTLKAANATGTVGPNLDDAKPDAALVTDRVTNGKGVMPSFKSQLTPKQIADVAAFVSQNAGG